MVPVPSGRLLSLPNGLFLLILKSFLAAQETPIFEHVAAVGMKGPKGTFTWLVRRAWHLYEAVVERQRMSDAILPALLVLSVEREEIHDELVNLGERQHACRIVLDGHRDEGDVRVGRLGVCVGAAVSFVVTRTLQR